MSRPASTTTDEPNSPDPAAAGATDAPEADASASSDEGADAPWEGDEASESEPEPEPEPEPKKPPTPSLVEILRARLQEKDDQLHSYIAAYKQAKDEMGKAQERMKRDKAKEVARSKMNAARDLLEVADNLERTLQGVTAEEAADNLAQGIRMVHDQFLAVLTGFGVQRMNALGTTFDPKVHEAVGMVPAPPGKADQEVIFVQRAGYLFDGRLLRAAQVLVAAAS